ARPGVHARAVDRPLSVGRDARAKGPDRRRRDRGDVSGAAVEPRDLLAGDGAESDTTAAAGGACEVHVAAVGRPRRSPAGQGFRELGALPAVLVKEPELTVSSGDDVVAIG